MSVYGRRMRERLGRKRVAKTLEYKRGRTDIIRSVSATNATGTVKREMAGNGVRGIVINICRPNNFATVVEHLPNE